MRTKQDATNNSSLTVGCEMSNIRPSPRPSLIDLSDQTCSVTTKRLAGHNADTVYGFHIAVRLEYHCANISCDWTVDDANVNGEGRFTTAGA